MSTPFEYRHEARSVLHHTWSTSGELAWLSDGERETYVEIRNPRRREAWMYGRILAKQLILEKLNTSSDRAGPLLPDAILICSRDGLGRPTQPRIILNGQVQGWSLSIAHSDRYVLVALSVTPGIAVGADVTPVQALNSGFTDTWMTPWERMWLGTQPAQGARPWGSRLWAIKEALYKAVNTGEGFAPSRIEVRPLTHGGFGLHIDGVKLARSHQVFIAEIDTEVAAIVTVANPSSEGSA